MRRSEAGVALIRDNVDGGQTRRLARWNTRWQVFHFVAGHRRPEESIRTGLVREVAEERILAAFRSLGVATIPPPFADPAAFFAPEPAVPSAKTGTAFAASGPSLQQLESTSTVEDGGHFGSGRGPAAELRASTESSGLFASTRCLGDGEHWSHGGPAVVGPNRKCWRHESFERASAQVSDHSSAETVLGT
jgi:hypothetical protein